MLAVLKLQSHVFVHRCITNEFASNQNPWNDTTFPEQLSHQSLGGMPITAALHPNIEHDPRLIHHTPKPMLLAIDGDDHFTQMPLVFKGNSSCPIAPSRVLTELQRPTAHRFVSDFNAACIQHFFNHS